MKTAQPLWAVCPTAFLSSVNSCRSMKVCFTGSLRPKFWEGPYWLDRPACLHKGIRRPAPQSPHTHVPCISSKPWSVPRQGAHPPHHLLCPHPCIASRCSPAPYLHRGYCTHPCPAAPPSPPSEYSPKRLLLGYCIWMVTTGLPSNMNPPSNQPRQIAATHSKPIPKLMGLIPFCLLASLPAIAQCHSHPSSSLPSSTNSTIPGIPAIFNLNYLFYAIH